MTLPNFIIAGTPKAGTTSLSYYFRQHPDIYMSSRKELRYFLYDPDADPNATYTGPKVWIKTQAEYEALFDGAGNQKAIGEATPFYMASPVALRRIHQMLPDVKLIFSLREPVSAAYSAYWHNINLDKIGQPVEEALTESSPYVTGRLYFTHLSNWFELFERSQIKVVLFDDFKTDVLAVCQDVFRFLGISDEFVPDLTIRNQGGKPKNQQLYRMTRAIKTSRLNKALLPFIPLSVRNLFVNARSKNLEKPPPIPTEVEERLSAYYRDDIERLETLIERDLSAWKRP